MTGGANARERSGLSRLSIGRGGRGHPSPQTPLRARLNHVTQVRIARLAILATVVVGWEFLAGSTGAFFLPTFTETLSRFVGLLGTEELWLALGRSNLSLLIGFPAALLVGIPVGFLLGRRRNIDRATSYLLDIMLVIPMIAIVPIIIVAFGLTLEARAFVVFMFALPLVALNARAAVRIIDARLAEMARAFGARPIQVWLTVILPAALGPIFTAVRLGLAHAISGMIVIELTLIPAGVGGLVITYQSRFDAPGLFAVTAAIVLEGVLLVGFVQMVEAHVQRRLGYRA